MTAKEKLIREVLDLDEARAAHARIVLAEPETDGEQPPFSLIAAFRSDRHDLGQLASGDVYEPEPFR